MINYSGSLAFLRDGRLMGEPETKAHWLGSPYASLEWNIGVYTIDWERGLPDGSFLNESKNRQLLNMVKRIVFEARNSPQSRAINNEQHYRRTNHILCLLDWAIHNQDRYNPRSRCFAEIDSAGIIEFVTLFAQGGPVAVSSIQSRIQRIFKSEIIERSDILHQIAAAKSLIPSNIFFQNKRNKIIKTFSDEEIRVIKTWLYLNDFYNLSLPKDSIIKAGMINRGKISELLGLRKCSYSSRIAIYLRQFEFVEDYNTIELNTRFRNCECIPCNSIQIEDAAMSPLSESQLKDLYFTIAALKRITGTVEGLPPRRIFEAIDFNTIANQLNLLEVKHYRTAPVPIALHIMNEAIRFVMIYGDPLVEYSLEVGKKLRSVSNLNKIPNMREKILLETPLPQVLSPLNIVRARSYYSDRDGMGFNVGRIAAPLMRKALSLEDALMMLITSVYIITAALSARRKTELCDLHFDCVTGFESQYEFSFGLAKANFGETRTSITRPIPNLVAKGLHLIKRFTEGWTKLFEIDHSNKLFWIPFELGQGSALNYNFVDILLNRFCDFTEVPVDGNGRRWYIRTHECRRFFAIVFFWQFKFSNISALQWMLGHVDPQHTYAYIKESLGGAEVTKEEARFTAAALKENNEDAALQQLSLLVQSHFHTNNVQLIEECDLEIYLEDLLDQGVYTIKPHTIETEEGVAYEILFEVNRKV